MVKRFFIVLFLITLVVVAVPALAGDHPSEDCCKQTIAIYGDWSDWWSDGDREYRVRTITVVDKFDRSYICDQYEDKQYRDKPVKVCRNTIEIIGEWSNWQTDSESGRIFRERTVTVVDARNHEHICSQRTEKEWKDAPVVDPDPPIRREIVRRHNGWGPRTFACPYGTGNILDRMSWNAGDEYEFFGTVYIITVIENESGDQVWSCDVKAGPCQWDTSLLADDPKCAKVTAAGVGDMSSDGFEEIGSAIIDGRTFPLYEGRIEGGQVAISRYGITLYEGQFWIHKVQDYGWFYVTEGDEIIIRGAKYRLEALPRTTGYDLSISQLPEGIIVSCYTEGENWGGLESFRLVKVFETSHGRILPTA